ncbi:MAG: ferrous iron transport protein B [Bacteroidaceae bacterium]|nr:ferrous iron transport protein B [Bacteroidaceae bacterium]
MKLSELKNGETAVIVRLSGHGGFRKRIMEMGFIRGEKVKSVLDSPMHDPVKYHVMGYDVSLRRNEASMIEVLPEEEAKKELAPVHSFGSLPACDHCTSGLKCNCMHRPTATRRDNIIEVALIGNPNSGKTSLFNALSGSSEHVGNYSGVTVDAKTGSFNYKGYRIIITDLPGTYSISAYSPEERYVRRHLFEQLPDVIINAVVASNLERNLYLTTELIDMNLRTVVALNMYDELEASGAQLDYNHLGGMLGIPMIPTVAKTGRGLDKLLDTVIELFEGENTTIRHIHINYGNVMENEITPLSQELHNADDLPQQFPVRYWALKLLEQDKEALSILQHCKEVELWKTKAAIAAKKIQTHLGADVETAISDAKYGFINGALHETFTPGSKDTQRRTRRIDRLVANKWLGFPLFLALMWLMFTAVFQIGVYPQDWIDSAFGSLGEWITAIMPKGWLQDLLVNGIIGGVGSVAVFLPQILILYLFISLMEDSGYMARAAFIMDRIMHRMGLHGKSFIPMLMGFGCNVPAIMATRTIESRSSRIITVLITPFMSCSARLPVLILFAGTFFPDYAPVILIGLYILGVLVAAVTARLLRKTKFKADETPFVMELPPYRIPTLQATLRHMWEKCEQYLRKIGTTILAATIIIWFLSYFPRPETAETISGTTTEQSIHNSYEHSYISMIGKTLSPLMEPLGLNWRATIGIITSIPAKELVVSTLGVLYSSDNEQKLQESLVSSGDFDKRSAASFLVFILLFFPCIATVSAIAEETHSKKWALFSVLYNTTVAWIAGFVVYHAMTLLLH